MQAQDDVWDWLWADNCCIDKTNSVELSEAINSMFKYYKEAKVCYAYLADVDLPPPHVVLWKAELGPSRWFKRGWTLQELLAPSCLEFFSRTWDFLGCRNFLREAISIVTGIKDE